MRKIFLFLCSIMLLFSFQPQATSAEIDNNSIRLLRVTNGESISLSYLFPVNSQCFENVDAISFEGFKYYLKSTVSLLSDGYRERAVDGVTVTEPVYYADYDAVGFVLKFDSVQAYQTYFEIDADDSAEPKTSGVFIKKTTYTLPFPFSTTSADSLINLLKNTVIMWSETFNKDISTIVSIYDHTTFVYQMISPYKTIRSENLTNSGGVYYNTFTRNYDELEQPITIYTIQINRAMWYMLALIVVVTAVIIIFVWRKLSTKRKNQN